MEFAASLDADERRADYQAHLIGWSGRADADGNLWSSPHRRAVERLGLQQHPRWTRCSTPPGETALPARQAVVCQGGGVAQQDCPDVSLRAQGDRRHEREGWRATSRCQTGSSARKA